MNKILKYVFLVITILIIFIVGFFAGNKNAYKSRIDSKYCTDNKTGVQYIVVTSKDGGIAIYPRLNSDGTLYVEENFTYLQFGIKGEINE